MGFADPSDDAIEDELWDGAALGARTGDALTSGRGLLSPSVYSCNSAMKSSVAIDLASRRSRRFIATLVPVQIVLRLHHLLGFISLVRLRLIQCVEWDA